MRSAGHLTLLTTLGLAASLSGCRQQYYVENRYLSEATSLPAAQNKQAAVQVEPAEAYAGDARPTKVPTKYVMFPALSPEPSVPSPEGYSSVSAPNYAKSRKVGLALTIPGGLLVIGGILGAALGSGTPTGDDCGTVTSGMTDTCMGNRLLGLGTRRPRLVGTDGDIQEFGRVEFARPDFRLGFIGLGRANRFDQGVHFGVSPFDRSTLGPECHRADGAAMPPPGA